MPGELGLPHPAFPRPACLSTGSQSLKRYFDLPRPKGVKDYKLSLMHIHLSQWFWDKFCFWLKQKCNPPLIAFLFKSMKLQRVTCDVVGRDPRRPGAWQPQSPHVALATRLSEAFHVPVKIGILGHSCSTSQADSFGKGPRPWVQQTPQYDPSAKGTEGFLVLEETTKIYPCSAWVSLPFRFAKLSLSCSPFCDFQMHSRSLMLDALLWASKTAFHFYQQWHVSIVQLPPYLPFMIKTSTKWHCSSILKRRKWHAWHISLDWA